MRKIVQTVYIDIQMNQKERFLQIDSALQGLTLCNINLHPRLQVNEKYLDMKNLNKSIC